MRRITRWLVLMIFTVLLSSNSFASHEIMKWRDNRAAAVSLTFDDGYLSQATMVPDILAARNFRGTFFLTINSLDWSGATWEDWRDVAGQGHEIGSHSVSHPSLPPLSEEELRAELSESQEAINLNIPTQSCQTFAYPFGHENDFVQGVTSEYYLAARQVWSKGHLNHYPGGPYSPVNFFSIGGFELDSSNLGELLGYLDSAEAYSAWFCVFTHDISLGGLEQLLSQFADELLTRDIWVDTLGTIVKYMREKIDSTVTVLSESDTEITLSLTHSLDNNIYNEPLTVRSTVPSTWVEVEVIQGDSVSVIESVIEGNDTVVYYNAVPNAEEITLTPSVLSTSPRISRNPASLSAFSTQGSQPANQTFAVWNSGADTLDYSISVDESWLSCNPANGTSTSEHDTITVSYSSSSLSAGTYLATITIIDPDADNSPQTIPVSLTVVDTFQPVLELNFEEGGGDTAFDTSGNNNHGTVSGAVYTTDSAGGTYALSFDGDNDDVVCQEDASLRPHDMSLALWVKHVADTSTNYGGIMEGASGDGYFSGFRVLDYSNKPLAQINFGDSTPVEILGEPFAEGEWSHIVLTYDHQALKLYENAELVVEIPETRDINWETDYGLDLSLGWSEWYFEGMIDNVSMYGYPLNEQEVEVLYNYHSNDCINDSDCIDTLYCNGTEVCVDGACQAGSDPCPGKACDEVNDRCVSCMIATASYGSPIAREVDILRAFRDRHMMTAESGRAMIDLYYKCSPELASFIGKNETLRTTARWMLNPIVSLASIVINF